MSMQIVKGEDTVSGEVMLMLHYAGNTIILRKKEIERVRKVIETMKE